MTRDDGASISETLKRALGPLRPTVARLWSILDDRWATHGDPFPVRSAGDGVRPLTKADIRKLTAVPYYRGRGRYLTKANSIAADLIDRYDLRTALELGPNLRSMLYGADVMDLVARPELQAEGSRFVHDARDVPWPFDDGAYDLFIALQVFEHLGPAQRTVFAEVARVAHHAIVSLPIGWKLKDTKNVHHGLTHERALSWFAPWEPTRVVEGNGGSGRRLIYVFEGLGGDA